MNAGNLREVVVWGLVRDDRKPLVDETTRSEVITHNTRCLAEGRAGEVWMDFDEAQDLLLCVLASGCVELGETISHSMRQLSDDRTHHLGSMHSCIKL